MDFTWQVTTGRYRGPDGRFVPDAAVRQAVDQVLDASTARVRTLGERLLLEQTRLAEWQQAMASELKTVHVAVGTIAQGGLAQMSPADYGFLGSQIKPQLAYLRDFAAQIAAGQQPLDGRVRARAELYAQAARGTFEEMRRRDMRLRGVTEARRVLHAAEHCAGCTAEAARGYVPIADVAPIGSQPCRSRCRCTIQYRLRQEAA